jgi:hypothetical protein
MDDVPPARFGLPAKQKLLQVLGPGLITGAADDDPSGTATYSHRCLYRHGRLQPRPAVHRHHHRGHVAGRGNVGHLDLGASRRGAARGSGPTDLCGVSPAGIITTVVAMVWSWLG